MKLKIKKGDIVSVISGSQKGKTGKVLAVSKKNLNVLVEGVNLRKKHVKPTQQSPQGGIITKEAPIHYSNVLLMDSKGKPTRVGIKKIEKKGKVSSVRFAKTTKQELTA